MLKDEADRDSRRIREIEATLQDAITSDPSASRPLIDLRHAVIHGNLTISTSPPVVLPDKYPGRPPRRR